MKILIVGFGSIGRRHFENLSKLSFDDILVCDLDPKMSDHALLSKKVPFFTSIDAALLENPQVVFLANPTSIHISTAIKAAQQGCDLFIEKPLSNTWDEVDKLIEIASSQQLICLVAYVMRFHPGLRAVKNLIESQAVGKIISAHAQVGQWLPDWRPGSDYRLSYSADSKQGGGVLLDLSHELDYLFWLLGPLEEIFALSGHRSSLDIQSEDVASILMKFGTGAIAELHLDYIQRPPQRNLQILGENGTIEWDYYSQNTRIFDINTKEWRNVWSDQAFDRNQMYLNEILHFMECVQNRTKPLIDLHQGAYVLKTVLAAYQSNNCGSLIKIGN